MKTGVYLCQCGGNISNTIDLQKVADHVKETKSDIIVQENSHMCSGAGQKMIIEDIKANNVEKVVIASCSPHFHEKTFRAAMVKAGLNPYVLEIANFREHCSWAHKNDPEAATEKAVDVLDASIAKVEHDYPLEEKKVQMGDDVLVIGGGIAGIQTALDLGDSGKNVTLVEREPTLGGKMAILTKTFPTEDCAACIISPKMAAVQDHPNIKLYTNSEIDNIAGHRLHFEVKIRKKPRYILDTIDMDQCLICTQCTQECPITRPNHWEQGIMDRKAIYIPAPHAIPYKYLIDPESCLHFTENSCTKCQDICPQKVIDFEQKEEVTEIAVDSVVVATGYDIYDATEKTVFGYGKYKNVVTALEMERIVDHISETPPPREVGKRVAFVQCIGSRDEQIGREYCSRVCCMFSIKLASLLKQAKPETDIYIFYTDIRAFGKGYEEYYKRAQNMGIKFLRGKPSHFTEHPHTKQVIVTVEDTLSRNIIESEFDLVVLANGMGLSSSSENIANDLKLAKSDDGFFKEAHPKYRPVDTLIEGVFLAGAAQGPKDIPDSVTQASAAAGRVIATLAQKEFSIDPVLAFVHQDICNSCKQCLNVCPKQAISLNEQGKAEVNEALCLGCGSCISSCPLEAIDLNYYTNKQLYAEISASLQNKKQNDKRLLIFADDNTAYRLADACGVRKIKYSTDSRIFRVPSGSRITPALMLYALKKGADAVMIADSPEKSSRFNWANAIIREHIEIVQKKLNENDEDTSRVTFKEYNAGDLNGFVKDVDELAEKINALEPISDKIRESF